MKWFQRRKQCAAPPTESYPALATERLVLRQFDPGDAVDVFAYAQNPAVGPMAGWMPHRSIEDSRRVVAQFIRCGDVWAIVEKKTGRVIGSVGLHRDGRREVDGARMLGYVLGEPHWGQGYATEAGQAVLRFAFERKQCRIVTVYHYPGNARSKRVIKKLGFVPEGTLRMAGTLPNGQATDMVCYSLTKAEYEARAAGQA